MKKTITLTLTIAALFIIGFGSQHISAITQQERDILFHDAEYPKTERTTRVYFEEGTGYEIIETCGYRPSTAKHDGCRSSYSDPAVNEAMYRADVERNTHSSTGSAAWGELDHNGLRK